MYFDRFDICEAWYLYASHYHGGQNSRLYAILGRLHYMEFRPAPALSLDSLSDNARAFYDNLVEQETYQ